MGFTSTLTKAATGIVNSLMGAKAVLLVVGSTSVDQIPVQFNPSEYKITDRSVYSQRSRRKKDEPAISFNGGMLSTLEVTLIFNNDEFLSLSSAVKSVANMITGDDSKDITKTINKIASRTKMDGESHQPPGCMFVWGSLQFAGYVESVGVNYTMFDKSGKPLRATVDLTMQGFNKAASERSSPLMSPDRTKARTMTEDSSIWCLAEKEYGDAREWRRIADANNIMNPLDIPVGQVLRVPSIND